MNRMASLNFLQACCNECGNSTAFHKTTCSQYVDTRSYSSIGGNSFSSSSKATCSGNNHLWESGNGVPLNGQVCMCGSKKWGGGFNQPNTFPTIPPYVPPVWPKPVVGCQHCYCTDIYVNGHNHKQCCMCGHRHVTYPIITWL